MFFRLGPPDFEDPALLNLWGNGSTITLELTEAMAAGDLKNAQALLAEHFQRCGMRVIVRTDFEGMPRTIIGAEDSSADSIG